MNADKTDAQIYINLELNRGVNTIDGQTEHLNYTTRSCARSFVIERALSFFYTKQIWLEKWD